VVLLKTMSAKSKYTHHQHSGIAMPNDSNNRKVLLDEDGIPKEWYNILPDLPAPLPPPINPATREPVKPHELERVFAKELIRQEMSQERWIPIPEELGRSTGCGGLRRSTGPGGSSST
jgi:Predicted alternative tryptophan synthase beta-subunit (paralog of TrpB)